MYLIFVAHFPTLRLANFCLGASTKECTQNDAPRWIGAPDSSPRSWQTESCHQLPVPRIYAYNMCVLCNRIRACPRSGVKAKTNDFCWATLMRQISRSIRRLLWICIRFTCYRERFYRHWINNYNNNRCIQSKTPQTYTAQLGWSFPENLGPSYDLAQTSSPATSNT